MEEKKDKKGIAVASLILGLINVIALLIMLPIASAGFGVGLISLLLLLASGVGFSLGKEGKESSERGIAMFGIILNAIAFICHVFFLVYVIYAFVNMSFVGIR